VNSSACLGSNWTPELSSLIASHKYFVLHAPLGQRGDAGGSDGIGQAGATRVGDDAVGRQIIIAIGTKRAARRNANSAC
jgi:hypothetical protein